MMVYRRKVKIKGQEYWYLFHTVREGDKFVKRAKYIGKELPKNIKHIEDEFLKEIKCPVENVEKEDLTGYEKIIESLHPLERKVLPFASLKIVEKIIKKTGLEEVEVIRALQWLENKNILKQKKQIKEIITLKSNGEKYEKEGLPEKRFLEALDKPLEIKDLMAKAGLDKDEIHFCLGYLKRSNMIEIGKEIKRLKKENFSEVTNFLKSLPRSVSELDEKEKKILHELKSRKDIVDINLRKEIEVVLTEIGE
ncbi:MAG: hypothetical protein AABX49_00740, partial [Nanoarchaeota archaeon]